MNDASRQRPVAFEVSSLLVRRPSGVGVYGQGLIRALAALRPDRGHSQIYRWTRSARRSLRPVPELPGGSFLSGARLHRRFGLVHCLDTRLPASFRGPLVATLFDVISTLPLAREKSLSSPRFLARKIRDYRRIESRADLVICLSGETRDRFLSFARPRGKVVVIPPGVGAEFLAAGDPDRPRPRGLEAGPGAGIRERPGHGGPYLLSVGALCARKNLEAVLGAFRRARALVPGLRLLVAGEALPGWDSSPARRDFLSMGEEVRLTGYLEREELAALYRGAAAFLHLSHYEGFGLTILEAMAAGAPVIASRRGGLPEAAGEAALLVDPDRPGEIDAALRKVFAGGSFVKDLRTLGRARASRFTWEAAARAVDAAYEDAFSSRQAHLK